MILNQKLFITLILASFLFAACAPGAAATPTAEVIPTVIADSTIIAEGRLEPIRFAEIAFTTSGRISDVLVQEGTLVKKGEELIRLGDGWLPQHSDARVRLPIRSHACGNPTGLCNSLFRTSDLALSF